MSIIELLVFCKIKQDGGDGDHNNRARRRWLRWRLWHSPPPLPASEHRSKKGDAISRINPQIDQQIHHQPLDKLTRIKNSTSGVISDIESVDKQEPVVEKEAECSSTKGSSQERLHDLPIEMDGYVEGSTRLSPLLLPPTMTCSSSSLDDLQSTVPLSICGEPVKSDHDTEGAPISLKEKMILLRLQTDSNSQGMLHDIAKGKTLLSRIYQNALSNEVTGEEVKSYRFFPKKKVRSYRTILSLLTEEYEFEEDTLVQLWMAGEHISDESKGHEYFRILLDEEYILCFGTNFGTGKKRYRINTKKIENMEDGQNGVVEDCQKGINNFYLKWKNEGHQNVKSTDIQHVSLVCKEIDDTTFQKLERFNALRTLLFLGNCVHEVREIPDNLFWSFKQLRTLDLSRTHIERVPSSVGHLIHLHYLDLSWTLIDWLPDMVCSLTELQTLKLKGCSNLHELPVSLKRLTKLRHLDIDVLRELEAMPGGIGALIELRTLSAFVVSPEDGCKIQELKQLNNLRGRFYIAMLENVDSEEQAREAALSSKNHLKELELRWTPSDSESSEKDEKSKKILECLQPCSTLEELRILCYEGPAFPDWMSSPALDQLVNITFYMCQHISKLPPLELLPLLKYLELVKMNSVWKIEWGEDLKQVAIFPSLEKLEIDEMLNLEDWSWFNRKDADFMGLVELSINNCPKLKVIPLLPSCLSSIKHLEMRECPELELSDELPTSIKNLIVEDCPKIKENCADEDECEDGDTVQGSDEDES